MVEAQSTEKLTVFVFRLPKGLATSGSNPLRPGTLPINGQSSRDDGFQCARGRGGYD